MALLGHPVMLIRYLQQMHEDVSFDSCVCSYFPMPSMPNARFVSFSWTLPLSLGWGPRAMSDHPFDERVSVPFRPRSFSEDADLSGIHRSKANRPEAWPKTLPKPGDGFQVLTSSICFSFSSEKHVSSRCQVCLPQHATVTFSCDAPRNNRDCL